jgi:hypothetical protein
VLILDERDAANHREFGEELVGDLRDHVPEAPVDGPFVGDLGAALLAHPDDEHLREAALDRPVEVGVGLDAVDGEDGVRVDGVGVRDDGHVPVLGPAHLDDVHARSDLTADRVLIDAKRREHLLLPLARRATVAPHRGEDERLVAQVGHRLGGGFDDHR